MVSFLPKLSKVNSFYSQIKTSFPFDLTQKIQNREGFFGPKFKQKSYIFASLLDLFLIVVIVFNGIGPAKRLIEPLMTPIQLYEKNIPQKNFAFAPGASLTKMDQIIFTGLNTLAFYDIPIDENGDIYTASRGYNNLTSDDGAALIQKSKDNGTKFLITVTLNQTDDMLKFLSNPPSQDNLGDNLIQLLDQTGAQGIALDFESQTPLSLSYQNKYSSFVEKLANRLGKDKLAVVVPQGGLQTHLYDLKSINKNSDQLLITTSLEAVPEIKNSTRSQPVYGDSSEKYWDKLSVGIKDITSQISAEKLALETAWYGNGNSYPMYVPRSTPAQIDNLTDPNLKITDQYMDSLVAGVPAKAREAARKNLPFIIQALKNEDILNGNVLAYALATIEHETASTFEPLGEYSGPFSARRLGYEGGTAFYGRGFIQLTHLRNYRLIGERIGMGDALAKDPSLASKPDVAARVLAAFFRDNNIANLASKGNFVAARRPVNPDSNGRKIALLALKYED